MNAAYLLGGGLVWTRRLRDSSDTGGAFSLDSNDVTVPVDGVVKLVEEPLGPGSADSVVLVVESDEANAAILLACS